MSFSSSSIKDQWELQRKCIQSFQESFLTASSIHIMNKIKSFDSIPPGAGLSDKNMKVHLCTIGYAYIFLQFVLLNKGTIYGGFLTSHFSGVPWNDIDIMFECPDMIRVFKEQLCRFMMFTTGIPLTDIEFIRKKKTKYSHRHLLIIGDIAIKVDITSRSNLQKSLRGRNTQFVQHPVTVGRMLSFNSNGLALKSIIFNYNISHYNVFEVVNILKEGKDIFFMTDDIRDEIRRYSETSSPEADRYIITCKNYFFHRLVKISDTDGYTILPKDWKDKLALLNKKKNATGQMSSSG